MSALGRLVRALARDVAAEERLRGAERGLEAFLAVYEARQLLRKRLLRDSGLGTGFHLGLQFGDLGEGTEREHLQVADDVRVV